MSPRAGHTLVLVACVAALAPAGAAGRAISSPSSGTFAGPVPIGNGRTLYTECRGHGSPTVVLEAGLRSRSDFWSVVAGESSPTPTVLRGISRFTRVCTYDRPGTALGTEDLSRSSPVPMPRTAAGAAKDLGRLLRKLEPDDPVVLVGHSTGGLIVRLYATLHARRVAGLIEVDALSELLEGPLTPEQIKAYDELNNGPLPGLEGYSDLERIGFRKSFAEMRRAGERRPLAGIPVTVISRRLPLELPPGLPAGLTTEVVERAWRRAQARLAKLTPTTRHVFAERSSHYVMFTQPHLIVTQVHRMVGRMLGG